MNVRLPRYEEAVVTNRLICQLFPAGFREDNVREPEKLRGVLDKWRYPPTAAPQYSGVTNRIAGLAYDIASMHLFGDGNKRTAAALLDIALRQNGYQLTASDADLADEVVKAAQPHTIGYTLDDFQAYIARHCQRLPRPPVLHERR